MTVAVNDILKIVWQAKVDGIGTRIQNVFYWLVSVLTDGDEANVATDFETELPAIFALVGDWFSLDYSLESIRVTNATQKTFVGEPTPVFVGGAAVDTSTPAQVAVQVLARAVLLGHTARKYVGPCIEATHTNGVIVAAALADFQAYALRWAAGFLAPLTINDYQPVMVKFAPGGGVASFEPISQILTTVTPVARTQRRRIPGRGLS